MIKEYKMNEWWIKRGCIHYIDGNEWMNEWINRVMNKVLLGGWMDGGQLTGLLNRWIVRRMYICTCYIEPIDENEF